MDTIFATASARGKAGVAVVRVSGSRALETVGLLAGCSVPARTASLRTLRFDGEVLDEAIVLTFPGPRSFTGEDVAEFHLHGSLATVAAVSSVLAGLGLRPAEPGEFTRRALENEQLDLAQVEGLSDLVEAETEAQRRQALRVFSGALGDKAQIWRSQLIRAAALLEATIDFADEEVPTDVMPEVVQLLDDVAQELAKEAEGWGAAERIREGFEVAIVGPPNIGKSTLLNALAGRQAAITSEIAGTTRDVIEVRMDLGGLPVTFLDTAGIRESTDAIEVIGVDLALERAERADLRLFLTSKDVEPVIRPVGDDIVVVPKADLGEGDFSAVTGEGLTDLVSRITSVLERRASSAGLAIRERHRIALQNAIAALGIARDQIETAPEQTEFVAEELRVAIRALDSLVGRIDVEHLLDEIFSSFCIGK